MASGIIFFERVAIVLIVLALVFITPSYALQITGLTDSKTSDALGEITDIIVGHGNKGPYSLSWTQIDPDAMTVVLGGRILHKGTDYNIDSANGLISFNTVLLNDAIVRVTYKKTGKSLSNSDKLSVPVTINLLQGKTSNVNITGLYAQDGPNNSEAGKTVVGIGGDKAWSGGKVESLFLISQRNEDNADTDESSSWDRSALKFGNATNLGNLSLTGSFMHGGKDFAGSNEYGIQAGGQSVNLAGTYGAGKSLHATFKFQDTQKAAGDNQSNYSHVNEQGMTYAPTNATKISIGHSTTETGNNLINGVNCTVESSRLQINQNLGAKTSTALSVENTNTTQGETADQVQTRQASVTTSAVPGVNVQGAVTQKDSQVNGTEQNVSAAVIVSPISQVSVKAAYNETDSEKNGQSASTNLSVKVKPIKNITVEGKITDQSLNEDDQFQRNLNLIATPIKNAKLTAQFSQKGANEIDDVTKGAALEVSPFDNTKLAAGFKYIESGLSIMTIRDYAASTSPWTFFSLSGSFRDRQLQQDVATDTTKFNLALSPVSFVKLTGDYQENPEDTDGSVQKYKATAMGMKLNVGSVGLLTNYTTKNEYLCSRLSDEREVGLEMPAFGHGKIKTDYKITRLLDGSEFLTNTYSLGYEHSLGSDFNLSLTGYYLQYMQDQVAIQDKSEYKSELNLGIKF